MSTAKKFVDDLAKAAEKRGRDAAQAEAQAEVKAQRAAYMKDLQGLNAKVAELTQLTLDQEHLIARGVKDENDAYEVLEHGALTPEIAAKMRTQPLAVWFKVAAKSITDLEAERADVSTKAYAKGYAAAIADAKAHLRTHLSADAGSVDYLLDELGA